MKMKTAGASVLAAVVGLAAAQQGPGAGEWQVVSPESEGLSTEALRQAADKTKSDINNRKCYLVVKNGKIVYEQYYDGWTDTTLNEGMSTTKSMCSTLFGIGVQQGFLDIKDSVTELSGSHFQCARSASWENVLTMTGKRPGAFQYEALGWCYDRISDIVEQRNPEGLTTNKWKEKHLLEKLGMKNTRWSKEPLTCYSGALYSCRDIARGAQLWLNEGYWPGAGQLMNKAYAQKGTTWVYPDSDPSGGDPYGYGVRLRPTDSVDPGVAYFGGVGVNCAYFSKKHNAIVVSMGNDQARSCKSDVWEQSRSAVISRNHVDYWRFANGTSASMA